jgi:hypothetical protein
MCGLSSWNGLPIPLELDHIDGDHSHNNMSNLRLLCCNCHAQTPTWRGRKLRKPECCHICSRCFKKEVSRKNLRCKSCAAYEKNKEKIKWPNTETLRAMVAESNYRQVGLKLGVTDNAVRKRLKNH